VKSSKAQILAKFHKIPVLRFEDQQLTSFSGLLIFQQLFQRIQLKQRLRVCFAHLTLSPIFGRHLVVLLLVVHLLLGFRRLREVDYYRDDPIVLRLMGLRRLPDVATICRALGQMDAEGVEHVRQLSRSLVIEGLQREQLPRVTLDFDGSVQSTKGHAEGTAVGFNKNKKGARSYYPLFCTVAQTGQFFDLFHRPGNVHDSNGAAEFMLACLTKARSALKNTIFESRVDSAFFDQDILLPAAASKCIKIVGIKMQGLFDVAAGTSGGDGVCPRRFSTGAFHGGRLSFMRKLLPSMITVSA
jgi:hypothetical protein